MAVNGHKYKTMAVNGQKHKTMAVNGQKHKYQLWQSMVRNTNINYGSHWSEHKYQQCSQWSETQISTMAVNGQKHKYQL